MFSDKPNGRYIMAEFQHLTDEQLLEEIKRQRYDKGTWDYEMLGKYGSSQLSLADDYFSSDVEEHIYRLEQEYKSRGFELPDRWEYVAQFRPDDESGE
jgi:hypothetical protein